MQDTRTSADTSRKENIMNFDSPAQDEKHLGYNLLIRKDENKIYLTHEQLNIHSTCSVWYEVLIKSTNALFFTK